MAVIPQPTGLTFERWAASVFDAFPQTLMQPVPEGQWRTWASTMLFAFEFSGYTLPLPDGFATWQEWADAILLTYPQLGY